MASRRVRKYKNLSNYLESLSIDAKEMRIRNDYGAVGETAVGASQLADEVQLVDKALQSNNYVSGSSGWAIFGDGNAEFENAYIRGDINATTGTIGYWRISPPVVQRTFGTTTLFGTFLESSDFGFDDGEVTTGTYVSLFKSYEDAPLNFSAVSVASNFVTITVQNHSFDVGDSIIVTFEDSVTYSDYNTTEISPGTVVSSTDDTITYSIGTLNEDGAADIATTEASGEIYRYVEDVAGLYLRDYGKREFDYGYFSNKGVSYKSADVLNLVHNPSFESTYINNPYVGPIYNITAINSVTYNAIDDVDIVVIAVTEHDLTVGDNPTIIFDNASYNTWFGGTELDGLDVTATTPTSITYTTAPSGQTITTPVATTGTVQLLITSGASGLPTEDGTVGEWTFSEGSYTSLDLYNMYTSDDVISQNSVFAANIAWSTTAFTTYIKGTVDYLAGDQFKLWSENRTLYLNFDLFMLQTYNAKTISSLVVNNATTMTVTTATHGLSAGDLVRLDFNAIDAAANNFTELGTYDSVEDVSLYGPYVFKVLTVTSTTAFTVQNPLGITSTGTVTRTGLTNNDGTTRLVRSYKVFYPTLDTTQIRFKFSNGTTTALANVMSSSAYTTLTSGNTEYAYSIASTVFEQAIQSANLLEPLSTPTIGISGDLLQSEYIDKDPSGYALGSNIYIEFPAWFYQQNATTFTSTTKITDASTVKYVLDNVSLSTNNKFFFGNYYDPENEVTLPSVPDGDVRSVWVPAYPSYLDGNTWIDINLDAQTYTLGSLDKVSFDYTEISKTLYEAPHIVPIGSWQGTATDRYYDGLGSLVVTSSSELGTTSQSLTISSGTYSDPRTLNEVFFKADTAYVTADKGSSIKSTASWEVIDDNSAYQGVLHSGLDIDALSANASGLEEAKSTLYASMSSLALESSALGYIQVKASGASLDTGVSAISMSADSVTIGATANVSFTAPIRYTATVNDVTLTSNNHPLQIGAVGAAHLKIDDNEIQAVSATNTAATLSLNTLGGGVTIGNQTSGTINIAGGNGGGGPSTFFGGLLSSDDTYSNDITTTRRAMWIASSGTFGWASSSRTKKQDIVPADLDVESILSIEPVKFRYIQAVEELGDAAEVEVGFIAEDLHDAGLTQLVDYGKSGEPEGIHYQTYVVALQSVVKHQHEEIESLKQRVAALGG